MEIIERILNTMKEKKIKQTELSEELEVNKSVVSSWKARKTNPPAEYLVQISKLLNVSIEYLLTGKESKRIDITESEEILLEKYKELTEKNKGRTEQFIDERLKEQETKSDNFKSSTYQNTEKIG